MEPEVLFESNYTFHVPYDKFCLSVPFLLFFLILSLIVRSFFGFLFTSLFCWLLFGGYSNEVKEHDHTKIQVTTKDIRIIRINGPIVRVYPFKDLKDVYAQDDTTISIKMRSDSDVTGYHLLTGVGNAKRFAAIAQAQAKAFRQAEAAAQQKRTAPQIPGYAFQPHQQTMPESEADSLHAAEQLLMTGQITQGQYNIMIGRAAQQPLQQPLQSQDMNTLDLQNAADFMQRNEMIAQQMRAERTHPVDFDRREDESHGGTGFISGEG